MDHTITAIFEARAFRPLKPVDWPDGARAEVILISDSATPTPSASGKAVDGPTGYFEQTAGALEGEEFERPPQWDLPRRINRWSR